MATYTMETRKRVEAFLRGERGPHSRKELQYLGLRHKQVRFESLVLILKDLAGESKVEFVKPTDGRTDCDKVRWRRD